MNKIFIGFDFSINKPAATVLYNQSYYHLFWPISISKNQYKSYEDSEVIINNRNLDPIKTKTDIESSQLVLLHTIRSTDLANLIIEDIDNLIYNTLNVKEFELYICSEGLSYASNGNATLNLATYKGVFLSKIYEHYGDNLKRLFTYSPIQLKSTANCASKQDIKDKNKMIQKYILERNNIKLRLCLANGYMKAQKNYIKGIDDIVDSYWALQTMLKKEKL